VADVLGVTQACCGADPAGPASTVVARLAEAVQGADLDYLSQEIPQALQQSLDGVNRVAKIVRAMKEFSHPGSEEKKPVDLNHALETTITVARNEWKYVAEVELRFDATLPLVPGLPGELNQVFLNLLVNAAQAIGEMNGAEMEAKRRIIVSTGRSEGWAEIRIADQGPGIPESIRHRLFEPFFTTKQVGKGTGQGLAIAHDVIVKKHRGQLFVESELGKGSTFVIRLPCHMKPSGAV
jgi:two-component system, NtrC family, sensor kinase